MASFTAIMGPLDSAFQVWTTVPIYPTTEYAVHRVTDKDVRFLDLNRAAGARRK